MDKLTELEEKKGLLETEAREILEGATYTKKDNEKTDILIEDIRTLNSQIDKIKEMEGIEEK